LIQSAGSLEEVRKLEKTLASGKFEEENEDEQEDAYMK
jgi:hypothetical protein